MAQSDSIHVTISCLCGKHEHIYAIPSAIKTIDYFICHCNSCRKSSGGSLYQGAIVWQYPLISVSESKEVPEDPKTLLHHYSFGPTLDYWFCETCSTKMYWQYKKPDAELEIFPGLFPEELTSKKGITLSCLMQVHVGDTLDEGLSRCFMNSDGNVGSRRQDGSSGPIYQVDAKEPSPSVSKSIVEGQCHCKTTSLSFSHNQDTKLRVELGTSKEFAMLNSVEVSVWVVIQPERVLFINGSTVESIKSSVKNDQFSALGAYESNSGNFTAYFCRGCSATIFLEFPIPVNGSTLRVGAGLLSSQIGARAEDILNWDAVEPYNVKERNILVDPKRFRSSDTRV